MSSPLHVPLVYKAKPLFGFDIGNRTVKVIQLKKHGHHIQVAGFGFANFPPDIIVEGIISDAKAMANALGAGLRQAITGRISAHRVAVSLPIAKVFVRTLHLPPMNKEDMDQAVKFETEQYVPVPLTDLYLDYEVIRPKLVAGKKGDHIDVLMVAAPRAIVDSYIQLFNQLNLEIEAIELSLTAVTRAMTHAQPASGTTLLIDFGSVSSDLSIYDQVIRLTGTVPVGGDQLTKTLSQSLGISPQEANEIKYKFGLGPSGFQQKVVQALDPQLNTVVTEVKRVMKYYKERSEDKVAVQNMVLSGGSASMPGLFEYLKKQLGLPMAIANPWSNLVIKPLRPPAAIEQPMYTTAIGLALKEFYHD